MKLRVLCTLCLLFVPLVTLKADTISSIKNLFHIQAEEDPSASIKVLLSRDLTGAILEVRGGFKIFDPATNKKIGGSMAGKNYFVQPTSQGLKWGEAFPGVYQLKIVPDDVSCLSLVNGIQYSGTILVYQIGDRISIVNDVDIENYVKSMLGKDLSYKKHPEVIAALAITVRTSAYYQAIRNPQAFWHLDAGEVGYEGYAMTMRDNGIDEAVTATRALVMQSNMGFEGFFDATYTSNASGKTAPYHLIFRKNGFAPLAGVKSIYSARDRTEYRWDYTCSLDHLAQLIGIPKITSYELLTDQESEKVIAVRLYNDAKSLDLDFMIFQTVLGADHLKSNDFQATLSGNNLNFAGYGEGFGVGLCLHSADVMAKKGHDAAEILQMFFPETELVLADTLASSCY